MYTTVLVTDNDLWNSCYSRHPLLRRETKAMAKVTDVLLKQTLNVMDSHYHEIINVAGKIWSQVRSVFNIHVQYVKCVPSIQCR